jgi:hypothetical protein
VLALDQPVDVGGALLALTIGRIISAQQGKEGDKQHKMLDDSHCWYFTLRWVREVKAVQKLL